MLISHIDSCPYYIYEFPGGAWLDYNFYIDDVGMFIGYTEANDSWSIFSNNGKASCILPEFGSFKSSTDALVFVKLRQDDEDS